MVAAALLGLGIPAAFADASPSPSYYLALGDSLAAGFQPDGSSPDEGYVSRVHSALATRIPHLELENLACNGATTTTLRFGGGCTYSGAASQLAAAETFLRDHRGRIRLITIDIGGNDINRCAAGGRIDVPCAEAAIGTISDNLTTIVQRLRAAAPGVLIVGMTYYDPYLAAWRYPMGAGEALAKLSVQLITRLNATLADLYSGPRIRVADVAHAFGTPTSADELTGTNPPSVANICTLTWMCRRGDIHPDDEGYQVIATTFLAEIPGYPQAASTS